MKNQFLNLGKALSRAEHKEVLGGCPCIKKEGDKCDVDPDTKKPGGCYCTHDTDCRSNTCTSGRCY